MRYLRKDLAWLVDHSEEAFLCHPPCLLLVLLRVIKDRGTGVPMMKAARNAVKQAGRQDVVIVSDVVYFFEDKEELNISGRHREYCSKLEAGSKQQHRRGGQGMAQVG
jgi:hypothetical protein